MSPKLTLDQPGAYQIRVQGRLGEKWAGYFGEMNITLSDDGEGNPVTVLSGVLLDQAAVQGVLQKLYNLGFPLLSVEKVAGEEDGAVE